MEKKALEQTPKAEQAASGKTELEYSVAPIRRRFAALLIDLFLIVLLASGIYAVGDIIFANTSSYQENSELRAYYQNLSGLYVDGTTLVDYLDAEDDMTDREKKDELSAVLDAFYQNPEFCGESAYSGYNSRKGEAYSGVYRLFVEGEDGTYVENSNATLVSDLYDWYCEDFLSYAMGYLSTNEGYSRTTAFFFWGSVTEIVIGATVSLLVFWLLVPLAVFRRGRMTIGRKLLSVAILGSNALTPAWWKYLLRFLFIYVIYIWLGFFAFLIPEFVAMGMQMFSKRQQDLAEYVLNQYSVDCRGKDVYLDYGDYLVFRDRKGRASLFSKEIADKNARNG